MSRSSATALRLKALLLVSLSIWMGLPALVPPTAAQALAATSEAQAVAEIEAATQRLQALSAQFGPVIENVVEDPNAALQGAMTAKKEVAGVRRAYQKHAKLFPKNDYALLTELLKYYDILLDASVKTAKLSQDLQSLNALLQQNDRLGMLSLVEIMERSLRELAADWDNISQLGAQLTQRYPDMDLSENNQAFAGLAQTYRESAGQYQTLAQNLRNEAGDQAPVFREFQPPAPPVPQPSSEKLSPEVLKVFQQFDKNKDKKISLGEGENFFYWVDKNVKYRYDDEKEDSPTRGYTVGDGRPGNDYRQKPHETLKEMMGDCEDTATLQANFYRSFGSQAYVICVNATDPQYLDHAIAIVKIAGTPEQYRKALGGLLSYKVEPGQKDVNGKPVEPGYYMAVDNAYSSAFGYISGGVQPGRFRMKCIFPANGTYDAAWRQALGSMCGNFLSD